VSGANPMSESIQSSQSTSESTTWPAIAFRAATRPSVPPRTEIRPYSWTVSWAFAPVERDQAARESTKEWAISSPCT
jgi:hypothetical protein